MQFFSFFLTKCTSFPLIPQSVTLASFLLLEHEWPLPLGYVLLGIGKMCLTSHFYSKGLSYWISSPTFTMQSPYAVSSLPSPYNLFQSFMSLRAGMFVLLIFNIWNMGRHVQTLNISWMNEYIGYVVLPFIFIYSTNFPSTYSDLGTLRDAEVSKTFFQMPKNSVFQETDM